MNNWLSSTNNWLKKQYFNSTHYLQLLSLNNNNFLSQIGQSDIYLLGIKFSKPQHKEAIQLYNSILWFTYRDNITFQNYPLVKSDIGWGCMVRVGQMMLAHLLRVHKGKQYYCNQKWINKLLYQFINENGMYSIESLCKVGRQLIDKQPGEWYSPYDIAVVIKKVLQYQQQKMKKYPYQKSNIIYLKDNMFTQNKVNKNKQQQLFQKQLPIHTIITSSQFSLKSVFSQLQIKSKTNPKLNKINPCLLIIICRLGYKQAQKQLLQSLLKILKYENSCVGILGGRPGKAHYILGYPHCVKQQLNIQQFLCQNLFMMGYNKIDPSLGICFYIKNYKQLILLHQRLRLMNINGLIYCHEHEGEQFNQIGLQIQVDEEQQVFQVLE